VSTNDQTTGDVAAILPDVEQHATGPDRVYAQPTPSAGLADEHPEALVGAAFVGGLVFAKLLKRLGG
jgi:hypothetical protein